jgi:hypothetical protein
MRLLTLEDGTDWLSRNVGTELPLNAASYSRRAQISSTSRRKPEITHRRPGLGCDQRLGTTDLVPLLRHSTTHTHTHTVTYTHTHTHTHPHTHGHIHTRVKSADCHKCARTHTNKLYTCYIVLVYKTWVLFLCGKHTLLPRSLFKECISVYYSIFLRKLVIIATAIWLSALSKAGQWQAHCFCLRTVCPEKMFLIGQALLSFLKFWM